VDQSCAFRLAFPAGFALLLGACVAGQGALGPVSTDSAAANDCAPSGVHAFICGAQRPEDVARIPNTPWLVFSGFADGAGLKLVDARTRTMRQWYEGAPEELSWDRLRFEHCPSPPDPSKFNTQGLSLRPVHGSQHDLYVVNHGGRESIEVFRIDAHEDEPRLRWIGCVLMPPATPANSVATYADGTILASVLTHPGTSITDFVRGAETGGVYEWRPGEPTFRLLPGTRLRGNNGIETSLDDREFYVVAFGERAVVVYSRADTSQPSRKVVVPSFMPDNLHWDGSRLILAGMQYDEPACGGTRKIINGKADDMRCHRGYIVAELNPVTLDLTTIAYSEPVEAFNGVSAARVVGSELWLAAYQGDRIAVRPLPGRSLR
jgi:hypothetical protein